MIIHEHDFTGGKGCIHCNSKNPATTCRPREVPDPTPSGPRTSAVNDFDVIGRRLKEITTERDKNAGLDPSPSPVPPVPKGLPPSSWGPDVNLLKRSRFWSTRTRVNDWFY